MDKPLLVARILQVGLWHNLSGCALGKAGSLAVYCTGTGKPTTIKAVCVLAEILLKGPQHQLSWQAAPPGKTFKASSRSNKQCALQVEIEADSPSI